MSLYCLTPTKCKLANKGKLTLQLFHSKTIYLLSVVGGFIVSGKWLLLGSGMRKPSCTNYVVTDWDSKVRFY